MTDRMTTADAATLDLARRILERLASEASDSSHAAATDLADAADLGRFSEACTAAEDALFRALNVAASYLGDAAALAAHERWLARRTSEVE